jgi:hypothetical protein
VTGLDAVEAPLRAAVRGAGLEPGAFDPNNLGAAVAKYDLIDVGFAALPAALEDVETRRGIPALRELGFVKSAEGEDRDMEKIDASCLDLLAEEVNDGRVSILLYLTAETPRDPRDPAVRRRMVRLELPDHYFPRTFVIRDACVINAPTIWVCEHVWL